MLLYVTVVQFSVLGEQIANSFGKADVQHYLK